MRKRELKTTILCTMGTLLFFQSCVNDDYDLNEDIDMTIGVGGNLTLPTSNTVAMKMKDILDLDPDGIVRTKEGDETRTYYLIEKADNPSTFEFNLPSIEIADPNPMEFKLKYSVPDLKTLLSSFDLGLNDQILDLIVNNTSMIENYLPAEELNIVRISPEIELEYGFDALKFDFTMPKEVMALDSIGFATPLKPTFLLSTTLSQGKLVLHDVYAEFPRILNHDNITHGGDWLYHLNEDMRHVYNLPKDQPLTDDQAVPFDMEFVGLNLFDDPNDAYPWENCPWPWDRSKPEYANGMLEINEDVAMHGSVTIEGTIMEFINLAGNDFELSASVNLDAPEIGEVRVIVNPDVNPESTTIELNDLPDFLTDNEVTVVLQQPIVKLNVTANEKDYPQNPLPVKVNCWGLLASDKGITVNLSAENASDLQIGGEVNTNWCIWDGVKPEWEGYKYYQAQGFTHIIEEIPNRIDLSFDAAVVQEYVTLELGTAYEARIDYEVECPLALAAGSKIVYTETVDDLHKDLEDLDVKSLKITAQLNVKGPDGDEDIPFDKLDLKVIPLDVDGNKMESIQITQLNDLDTDAQIEINATCNDGALRRLEAFTFEVTARVTEKENAPLSELTTVQLTNVSVSVENGVVVDLN